MKKLEEIEKLKNRIQELEKSERELKLENIEFQDHKIVLMNRLISILVYRNSFDDYTDYEKQIRNAFKKDIENLPNEYKRTV